MGTKTWLRRTGTFRAPGREKRIPKHGDENMKLQITIANTSLNVKKGFPNMGTKTFMYISCPPRFP